MRNGIAITGASGFIGNRILEMFHLGKVPGLIPVVHSNSSLALPARFALPWKVCDHFSVDELSRAFEGCEAVVHAAYGSPMKTMSEAVYRAADRAAVRRLVVLSSASTYNQNPQPGVTEDSPYPHKAATSYNAAKIAADRGIRRLRPRGRTEVVFLMPGVVYGPRSQWIARVARQGAQGTAYLIDEGQGICNGIYIDNLVEAVRLALIAPGVDGHSFFVSDAETVTWADFYRPILAAIGAQPDRVYRIAASAITRETARERFRA
ncbi:MAG: NAD(P)-dependent oxidoreductase, partial [Acidobacteria bacterium]|nr:NAD(P)-dependent oxidoreductase [Acidobacteriota bacterium]